MNKSSKTLKFVTIAVLTLFLRQDKIQLKTIITRKAEPLREQTNHTSSPPSHEKLQLMLGASNSPADIHAEKMIRQLFNSGEFSAMEQLIQLQQKNADLSLDYLSWLRLQIPAMKLGWAWSYIRQRRCLDAIPLLEEVQNKTLLALTNKGLGYCSLQKKDFPQAAYYLEQYLEMQKNDPEAYILLAETKESLSDTKTALELTQRALALTNLTDDESKELKKRATSLAAKTEESSGQAEIIAGFIHLRYQSATQEHLVGTSLNVMQMTITTLNTQLGIEYPAEPIEVLFHAAENYQNIAPSPAWSSGLYDGRIHIRLPKDQVMDESFSRVLRHEITHALLSEQSQRRRLPVWFQEGLAQVAECPDLCWHFRFAASQFPFLKLDAFNQEFIKLDQGDAQVAYKQSFYLMQILRYQFGEIAAIRQIIEGIQTADDLSSDGILKVLNLSFEEVHRTGINNWKAQKSF